MEKTNYSIKYLKQRKFLIVLPILSLPFVTLMFWALGGGKGNDAVAQHIANKGLNLKLPDAKFKDEKGLNKLSFYQKAALDSAKAREAQKLDPYWSKISFDTADNPSNEAIFNAQESGNSPYPDYGMNANKIKVYNKLDELKKTLNESQQASNYDKQSSRQSYQGESHSASNEKDQLQVMMKRMKQNKTPDPEITQLNSMLDKIMAIQNPEQAQNTGIEKTEQKFPVKVTEPQADVSLLNSHIHNNIGDTSVATISNNAFYSEINNDASTDSSYSNSIEAIIPETQTIVAGATVKLTLSNSVTIKMSFCLQELSFMVQLQLKMND